jgi:tRNA(Ile)-lysidine synthase
VSLPQRFEQSINRHGLFQRSDNLLLAVSGGLDSVVLAHLCAGAGYRFSIAHCHFGLRGAESDRDASFVNDLATSLSVPVYIKRFDTEGYAAERKVSIQVAARDLRYAWFSELLNEHRLSCVVTAHHADDQIETVLMNLAKGTGIAGLTGIEPKVGRLVRPLLFASRAELAGYAEASALSWVEDSSNEEATYTRNRFRAVVMPAFDAAFPHARHGIAATIEKMQEAELLYNQAIAFHKKDLLSQHGAEVHIPIRKLLKKEPLGTILYEILKDYGFRGNEANEAQKLLRSESGRFVSSATHRVIRHRDWLVIAPLAGDAQSLVVIDKTDARASCEAGVLDISTVTARRFTPDPDPSIATLDGNTVAFPLVLRRWKAGDYFYPLGMRKKKKVARFLIDRKLSATQKEAIWVLESNQRIVWVIGQRIDDRCRVTDTTTDILRIRFTSRL